MEKKRAFQTANKTVKYDDKYYSKTIDELVQEAHKFNCEQQGWNFYPLKNGAFGYDNLAISLSYTLKNITSRETDIEKISNLIHEGWTQNYLFWRDNNPWEDQEYQYNKPYKPINDEQRNICANTKYHELPEAEKDKDRILAKFVVQILKN